MEVSYREGYTKRVIWIRVTEEGRGGMIYGVEEEEKEEEEEEKECQERKSQSRSHS